MNVEQKHISFLLGAGFSAPMGYPVGNGMNQKFLEFDKYFVDPLDGQAIGTPIEYMPNNHYHKALEFCKRAVSFYNKQNVGFDYERFCEIITNDMPDSNKSTEYHRIANQIVLRDSEPEWSQLLTDIEVIYNRLVAFFLKDDQNRQCYSGAEFLKDNDLKKYQNFINILNILGEKIHSLNHDLLFEALSKTSLIHRNVSDAFSPLNSCYGSFRRAEGKSKFVALDEYTGEYLSNLRLYKLHGSLDYWKFCKIEDSIAIPEQMLKIGHDVSSVDLFKIDPVTKTRSIWPFEYYPSFLTGTTSKERHYGTFFYNKLIAKFEDNLRNSELLVVIGYGFKDKGINNIIEESYDCGHKSVIVVDPSVNSNETISSMTGRLNAVRIEKSITEINIKDLV